MLLAEPPKVFHRDGLSCFAVRVQPRSSLCRVSGVQQGALKVHLTAPPLEDRANRQLIEFLAERLEIPKSSMRLLSGGKSRSKTVGVAGLGEKLLLDRLANLTQ